MIGFTSEYGDCRNAAGIGINPNISGTKPTFSDSVQFLAFVRSMKA
jgi:hypothetical protein